MVAFAAALGIDVLGLSALVLHAMQMDLVAITVLVCSDISTWIKWCGLVACSPLLVAWMKNQS